MAHRFFLSVDYRESEELAIYLHQGLELIICGVLTSTLSICFYGLLFRSYFNMKSLLAQLLLPNPTLHFSVIESIVQQDP